MDIVGRKSLVKKVHLVIAVRSIIIVGVLMGIVLRVMVVSLPLVAVAECWSGESIVKEIHVRDCFDFA